MMKFFDDLKKADVFNLNELFNTDERKLKVNYFKNISYATIFIMIYSL